MRRGLMALLVLSAGCTAASAPARPSLSPRPQAEHGARAVATVVPADRHEAAIVAFRAGLMPLQSTGIDVAAQLHPTFDGRGVLIAILDSGIDPSVAGLQLTSDSEAKLLDLRDFSGEGRIHLRPATLASDRGGSAVGSAGTGERFRRLGVTDSIWIGSVSEPRFGKGPGADLNGDGAVDDTIPVVVALGRDGWFMMTDTDLDGRLDDEDPYRDFAIGKQWFGWSADSSTPPRVAIAVNLDDSLGVPRLTLVFDADGHGTHVAGIAAGNDLYAVPGFDGVAPGAQLLGLKIAANGLGGVTTTGSLLAAMTHAVRFAEQRRLPLVLNLSFGVGNPRAGRAKLDALVDSILSEHPRVVMTVAVGNDGPGLGTIGFPASASEVIAVGATTPLVFAGMGAMSSVRDPVAHYSSRGGERPGPDLVAPGRAWSSVPRFEAGREELSGTSMAAPHIAGLAARLLSQLDQQGRVADRRLIRQALTATARPLPFATILDQGAGEPDLSAAMRWLAANHHLPQIAAEATDGTTEGTLWLDGPVSPEQLRLRLTGTDSAGPIRLRLRSTVPWLSVIGERTRLIPTGGALVTVDLEASVLDDPGVSTGTLVLEDAADEGLGILCRIPVTVLRRTPIGAGVATLVTMQAGETARRVFLADSGRGLLVEVETLSRDGLALVSLHEPDGQRIRDGDLTTAGHGAAQAKIMIGAEDVHGGQYELDAIAPATIGVAARIAIRQSPMRIAAELSGSDLVLAATNLSTQPIELHLMTDLIGAASQHAVSDSGATTFRLPVAVPTWARSIVVDLEMPEAVWGRFTDFGVTLRDRSGRLLAESPMTFAFGRLKLNLAPDLRGETIFVVLAPAFPRTEDRSGWRVQVRTEFRLADPISLNTQADELRLSPGERRTITGRIDLRAIGGTAGLEPIIRVSSRQTAGPTWRSELTLKEGKGVSQ